MEADRVDKAERYFKKGYNCSQSIVLAFCDVTGLSEDVAAKAASAFGGGMGRLREVCGAFSGMMIVVGMLEGGYAPADKGAKRQLYEHVQFLAKEFQQENGSIICRELLGIAGAEAPEPAERTEKYYKKRPCIDIVKAAAGILDRYIRS